MANADIGRNPRTPPTKSQLRDFFRSVRISMKSGAETAVVGQQWGAKQTTGNAGTAYTYHQTFTVERQAHRFRFKFLNTNTSAMVVNAVSMAVSDRLGTGSQRFTPSTGLWVPVTFNGGELGVTLRPGALDRPTIKWSDWIDCETITPTDGTTLPVVMLRAELPTGAFSIGNYDFTPWAAPSGLNDGRFLYLFRDAGAFASGSFTSMAGTPYTNPLIMGFEYETDGPAFTFSAEGDSITEGAVNGSGGNFGNGWFWRAMVALRAANPGISIGYVNAGISGSLTASFNPRLSDLVAAKEMANAIIYSPFSPNDGAPSSVTIAAQTARTSLALSATARLGLPSIVWTPCVNNTQNWDATADGFRLGFRTSILGLANGDSVKAVDIEAAVSDGATPARFQASKTTDGIHPNEIGHAAIATAFVPQMQAVLNAANLLAD